MGEPRLRTWAAAFLALLAGLSAEAQPAPGQVPIQMDGSAACTVRAIQGQPGGHDIDPRLDFLRPQFTQPPLSSFGFKLLDQHSLTIQKATPAAFPVPGEHQGQLAYLGHHQGPKKKRVRVRLTIKDGAARISDTAFMIDDGGTMLQAGIHHDGGILFLAITCRLAEK